MATVSVRISAEAHTALRQLAAEQRKSIGEVLNAAVAAYQREQIWQQAEAAYASLRADHEAWAEWQREINLFDSTAADGLDAFPYDLGTKGPDTNASTR
ncbi:MAG: toxin-antitoxin system protein [Chloroflexia bacterium]|nr:toxin-antitoxin system protein [Chloroflexia bacterium]